MKQSDFLKKLEAAFECADRNDHPDCWCSYDYDDTDGYKDGLAVPNAMNTLTSILYLKLEEMKMIPKFSDKLEKFGRGNYPLYGGDSGCIDLDPTIICTCREEVLKSCGYRFPQEFNYIPEPYYDWSLGVPSESDGFWVTDGCELDKQARHFLFDTEIEFYGEPIDPDDEVRDSDKEDEDHSGREIWDRDCYGFSLFCATHPKWNTLIRRFQSINKPPEVLSAEFERIDKEVTDIITPCTECSSTEAYDNNGNRMRMNAIYSWFCGLDECSYYFNPLVHLEADCVLRAVQLKKDIARFEKMLKEYSYEKHMKEKEAANN